MFNLEELKNQALGEMNADLEAVAKRKVKEIIKEIVNQQQYIKDCNKRIAELQGALKEITVETISL